MHFTVNRGAVAAVGLLIACDGSNDGAASGSKSSARGGSATSASAAALSGAEEFKRCVNCHPASGAGVPRIFPPLAGSEWVNGPPDRLIAMMLHGVQGPLLVKGATYSMPMMPYGSGLPMTDAQVAAVLTFIRSSWGNTGAAVQPADVARVRAANAARTTKWSAAELEAMP
jgi:mono/diheme cytochrome c family protein